MIKRLYDYPEVPQCKLPSGKFCDRRHYGNGDYNGFSLLRDLARISDIMFE